MMLFTYFLPFLFSFFSFFLTETPPPPPPTPTPPGFSPTPTPSVEVTPELPPPPWVLETPGPVPSPGCPPGPPPWWLTATPVPGWWLFCGHCVGGWPLPRGGAFPPTPTFWPTSTPVSPTVEVVTPTPTPAGPTPTPAGPTPTPLPGCQWRESYTDRLFDPNCVYMEVLTPVVGSRWTITWTLYPWGVSGVNTGGRYAVRVENFKDVRLVWRATGPLARAAGEDITQDRVEIQIAGGWGVIGFPVTMTHFISATLYPGSVSYGDSTWHLSIKVFRRADIYSPKEDLEALFVDAVPPIPSSGVLTGTRVITRSVGVLDSFYEIGVTKRLLADITSPALVDTFGNILLSYTNPRYVGGGDDNYPGDIPGGGSGDGGGGGDSGDGGGSLCLDPTFGERPTEILPTPRFGDARCVSFGPIGPYTLPVVGRVEVPRVRICFQVIYFSTISFLGFRFNVDLFLGVIVGIALIKVIWGNS